MTLATGKVGIICCSGEDFAEGTISRVATRLVLEKLRPDQTVTLCLPLFLAGGEDERAFARVFPTIAVDGCSKKCAEAGTKKFSGKPVATILVSEVMKKYPHLKVKSREKLEPQEMELAMKVAEEIAKKVDEIMQNSQEVKPQSVAEDKVAIIPCAGMDKALGSVARACAFIVVEKLRPDKTVLVCIPPLVAGVKPYSEILKTQSSIPIDGCAERCATKIAAKNGARIKARILIPESIQKHNLKPRSASDIGPDGEKLAEKLAEEIATEIDKLRKVS